VPSSFAAVPPWIAIVSSPLNAALRRQPNAAPWRKSPDPQRSLSCVDRDGGPCPEPDQFAARPALLPEHRSLECRSARPSGEATHGLPERRVRLRYGRAAWHCVSPASPSHSQLSQAAGDGDREGRDFSPLPIVAPSYSPHCKPRSACGAEAAGAGEPDEERTDVQPYYDRE
jgi:hypothetical protein